MLLLEVAINNGNQHCQGFLRPDCKQQNPTGFQSTQDDAV